MKRNLSSRVMEDCEPPVEPAGPEEEEEEEGGRGLESDCFGAFRGTAMFVPSVALRCGM